MYCCTIVSTLFPCFFHFHPYMEQFIYRKNFPYFYSLFSCFTHRTFQDWSTANSCSKTVYWKFSSGKANCLLVRLMTTCTVISLSIVTLWEATWMWQVWVRLVIQQTRMPVSIATGLTKAQQGLLHSKNILFYVLFFSCPCLVLVFCLVLAMG